jgi:hypothetical protein
MSGLRLAVIVHLTDGHSDQPGPERTRIAQVPHVADDPQHGLLDNIVDVGVAVQGPPDDVVNQRQVFGQQVVQRPLIALLRGDHRRRAGPAASWHLHGTSRSSMSASTAAAWQFPVGPGRCHCGRVDPYARYEETPEVGADNRNWRIRMMPRTRRMWPAVGVTAESRRHRQTPLPGFCYPASARASPRAGNVSARPFEVTAL